MRWIISVLVIIVVLLGVAVPRYLAPNDLAGCAAPASTGTCGGASAIVAISGGDTLARAREAVKLYKAGWSTKLIFSGAASDKTGPSNARAMKTDAVKLGVPASAILLDEESDTTTENAINVTKIARANALTRLIVVTSGYHERRASLEFTKAAGTGIQIVSHPVESDNQWSNWWWATPVGWWLSTSELVKIGAFYLGVG